MRVRNGLDEAEPRTEFSEERVGGVPGTPEGRCSAAVRPVRTSR